MDPNEPCPHLTVQLSCDLVASSGVFAGLSALVARGECRVDGQLSPLAGLRSTADVVWMILREGGDRLAIALSLDPARPVPVAHRAGADLVVGAEEGALSLDAIARCRPDAELFWDARLGGAQRLMRQQAPAGAWWRRLRFSADALVAQVAAYNRLPTLTQVRQAVRDAGPEPAARFRRAHDPEWWMDTVLEQGLDLLDARPRGQAVFARVLAGTESAL